MKRMIVSRRAFVATAAAAAIGAHPATRRWSEALTRVAGADDGRISARPRSRGTGIEAGLHTLDVGGARETVLFVPSSYRPNKPAPFMLALHGATGSSAGPLRWSRDVAEQKGIVLLSPSSAGSTWDAIRGSFGDDLALIDRALALAFAQCAIDSRRVAVAGFSDGASYAVSLGLIDGDLFTHTLGYSAGFVIPRPRQGRSQFFLSHGRQDDILPIDQCGRRIAADLRRNGFSVRFEEFDGGHQVPPQIVARAASWFLG